MKFIEYIKSLLPDFTKDKILENIEDVKNQINESTLPVYVNYEKYFTNDKLDSPFAARFQTEFNKWVKPSTGNKSFLKPIRIGLENAKELLEEVESLVSKDFGNDILRQAMKLAQLNTIRLLEVIGFFVEYSRRILVVISTSVANLGADKLELEDITPAELEWLSSREEEFFNAVKLFQGKPKGFIDDLKTMPDMDVSEQNINVVESTIGLHKVDPWKLSSLFNRNYNPKNGISVVTLNPIYHIRIGIAEWRHDKYLQAQQEQQMLEFRLIQLKYLQEEKRDPKIEREIEYNLIRLDRIRADIKRREEDYVN